MVEWYAAFCDDARLYIVMELCGGGDLLEKLLRDKKAMSERRVAVEVAQPCLAILRTLHEMRIIHRCARAAGGGGQRKAGRRQGDGVQGMPSALVPAGQPLLLPYLPIRPCLACLDPLQRHQAGEHLH